jgi:hypothetical protein
MANSILLPDAVRHKTYSPEIISKVREMTFEQIKLLHDMYLVDNSLTLGNVIELVYGNPTDTFYSQSSAVEKEGQTDTTNEVEENVHFADAEIETDLMLGNMKIDSSYNDGYQDNGNLVNFLSRPVNIYTITWLPDSVTPFFDVINPWELFLSDARVVNKIETFKLLHGTLKIKIVVNGSPYHYGRVFVGVRPTAYDNNTVDVDPATPVTTTNYYDTGLAAHKPYTAAQTLYSQRPHVFVDPATNQPSHIDWPFFSSANYLDLTNTTWIDRMGRLEIWELNTLRHNNGASDPLTINFYAWMENVTLTGLTQVEPAFSQSSNVKSGGKSGKKLTNSNGKDEYAKSGILSTPASALSSYAGYFTNIPYIGKYAMATKMAAGSIADIARLFGFARAPIINDVTTVRPQFLSNMANYSGGDALIKLSFDPKQELTVDPSTVGLAQDDQMSFGYICKKEALVDKTVWASSYTPGQYFYAIKVNPLVAPKNGTTSSAVTWQTPVSFVARPFKYWTGSLCYRFQIVASAFHRGRIAVVYEPSVSTDVTLRYNSRYVHILDLAEAKDFKVEVKWSQSLTYLYVSGNSTSDTEQGVNAFVFSDFACNGTLSLVVVNELASAETIANVDINVYISAGDDFQVQDPVTALSNYAYSNGVLTPGPPASSQSEIITKDENMPEQDTCYIINGSHTPVNPSRNLVYFGEQVVSVRSLLKRYCYHRTLTRIDLASGTTQLNEYNMFSYPVGPGVTYGSSVAGDLTGTLSIPFNVCAMTYIRYFGQAYIGWRGGIRYKAIVDTYYDHAILRVVRSSQPLGAETFYNPVLKDNPTVTPRLTNQRILGSGSSRAVAGTLVGHSSVNPSLEFELPFYSPFKYAETNMPNADISNQMREDGSYYLSVEHTPEDSQSNMMVHMYSSVGEDFTFFFFIGAPPLVFSTTITQA